MEQVKFLPLLIICVQTAKGFIWNSSTTSISVCVGNSISLDWVYTLESEIPELTSWNKYDGAGVLIPLADDFGGFTPATGYVGRLTRIGNAGIQISNATSSDTGIYNIVVKVVSGSKYTMNATVHVHEIANASCIPSCDSSWKCQIPQACPVKNYIDAVWTVDGVKHPNVFQCSPNNYNKPYNVCAEGDAVTLCYRELSLCCEEKPCIGTTTTTTIAVTSSFLSSTSSSATTDNKSTKPTTNGSTASVTSSTFTSISTPTVLPHNDTNTTSTSRSPTITGSAVSVTSSTSASTSSTAVSHVNNTSNVSTSVNPTTAEPTAITKTSTDNNGIKSNISDTDVKVIVPAVVVPCGLLIIVAIVLVIFCVRRKAGKNVRESPDGMAIQDKGNNIDGWKQSLGHGNNIDGWKQSFRHGNNIDGWKQSFRHGNNIDGWKQSFGHGKATDNLDTVYTTPDGFIYIGPAAVSTAGSYKDKKHHVVTDQYSRPYPDTYGNQNVYFSSTYKCVRTYAQKDKTYEGHQPASNPMATSRLAYDMTVCYPQTGYYGQIDDKLKRELTFKKSKTNNSGPRTFHTSTQYKVEPKTLNKQTDDRKQPVPPVNTGFEDTPTFRQLPQPPQNGEIKDQSLRGRSATIDDTPGLANETSRNNILPPLPLKQETVQEENASEKHKKKRKKKKKKDQMNVETPEEENGEIIV